MRIVEIKIVSVFTMALYLVYCNRRCFLPTGDHKPTVNFLAQGIVVLGDPYCWRKVSI